MAIDLDDHDQSDPLEIEEKRDGLNSIEKGEDQSWEKLTDERKSSPRLTDSPSFLRPCNINIRETRMQYMTRRDSRAQEYHESSGSTSRDESRQASRKSKFFTSASSTNLQLILHLFYAHVIELLEEIRDIFSYNKLDLFIIHFPLV